jgi:exodeoxyribonuclease V alpha subunit
VANDNLSRIISRFLQTQSSNPQVIELAVQIQNQVELNGSTAIKYETVLDDAIISDDGQSGYIVQKNGQAGFRRFYNQEQRIKTDFLSAQSIALDKENVKSAIQKVMALLNLNQPSSQTSSIDLQWQACLACLHQSRFILTGGPGTGKTTTVVRMMLLYLLLNKDKKIALSAPTGKAANQMMHSINQQLIQVELPDDIKQLVTLTAQTIHRLLGYNNQTNKLKYNKDNPLPYDLIIIDEASMLDVSLTDALLQALKPQAQLLLIGDKNQLPAVDAGNVFADLCQLFTKTSNSSSTADLLEAYINDKADDISLSPSIELQQNYRFSDDSVIAQLCLSLSNKENKTIHELRDKKLLHWLNPQNKAEKKVILEKWYSGIPNEETAVLLSAVNNGHNSVYELNDLAREILYQNKTYYQNMPVMITKNDYTLGVFNGDIGYMSFDNNQWQVNFSIEGENKRIQLSALHEWQQANAITIHKSQGSEYDHVLIAIPNNQELKHLTNALLYTAISRAKKTITLWANDEIIEKIIATNESRMTFLN